VSSDNDKIFVFGASGHAKVVIDIIERQGRYEIAFLADDDDALKGTELFGYPVVGGKGELAALGVGRGIVAIGSNPARSAVAGWLVANGYQLVSAVHPSAQLARGVSLGEGSVVMAGAVVNPDTKIGCNVIINTRASVDHDCTVEDGVHVAPGVTLCGTVCIGSLSFIGAGATVIPNLSVGSRVMVGAGATVVRDVPDRVTVVGSPARVMKCIG
jgi:sugar O-acyltransferase (sialic acid O-acetyltransferase NeuD family)